MTQLIHYTTIIFVFIFPLFFLPVTPDSYEFNKMYLLFITVLVLAFLLSLKYLISQKKEIFSSSFLMPLFLLSGLVLISALFQSSNIVTALITPLSASTIVAGFLLYVLLIPIINSEKELPLKIFNLLILSAIIVSFWTIAMYTGIFPPNRFTPAGSLLSTATFLAVITVYLVSKISLILVAGDNERQVYPEQSRGNPQIIIYILAVIFIAIALALLIFHLLTDQKPLILPFSFGWQILMEILKNVRLFFVGVGPANFVSAFTLTKPIAINTTPFWNVTFTNSSSFLLTLATETGILSAIFYLWIFLKAIKRFKAKLKIPILETDLMEKTLVNPMTEYYEEEKQNLRELGESEKFGIKDLPFIIPLLFALLLQMILPSNMTIFILTIILLAAASEKNKLYAFDLSKLGIFRYLLLLPVIAFITIILYFSGRAYLAEVSFKNSLDSIVNNQGSQAYNDQKDAVSLNPYLDRYHLAFSQTNLALANSLAGKEKISADDRQNIPRLIQQSIDHARSAALLNKLNSANWDNLARTYEALINFAQGSDNWAVESYRQKINLDPYNPQNYVALGKLLMSQKRFDEAQGYLEQGILLKNDIASLHYLLAIVHLQNKKYEAAYRQLQTAQAYLLPNSDDAKRVEKELKDLSKLVPNSDPGSFLLDETGKQSKSSELQTLKDLESSPSALKKLPTPFPTISL